MAYISTSVLAAYMEVDETTHLDILTEMVASASETVDEFTRRTFSSVRGSGFLTHTNINEKQWLVWTPVFTLREWPVVSVTSLTLNGDSLEAGVDYVLDAGSGICRFIDGSGYPDFKQGTITATYVAGYATVPAIVKQACYRLCSFWFARKGLEGVGAVLISDLQETFRIPEAQRILNDTLNHLVLDVME